MWQVNRAAAKEVLQPSYIFLQDQTSEVFSRQLSLRNGMHVNMSLRRTLHNTSRCRQKVDAGLGFHNVWSFSVSLGRQRLY